MAALRQIGVKRMNEEKQIETKTDLTDTTPKEEEKSKSLVSSMKEFDDQINKSFHKVNVGDIVKGTVVGISDTEVILDLGSYAEGIIKSSEYSNNPNFSIRNDVKTGDVLSAKVIMEDDGYGNLLLSKKQADFLLSWKKLEEHMENRDILTLKIEQAVKAGVITYVEGIRGFIPASQLSINYVEDLSEWENKEIQAIVISVDEKKRRLVLSAKEVELMNKEATKDKKLSTLEKGMITKGKVDKIVPYGAFVIIENGLSGLVHISQISNKFIKSPNEVIKEGQEVIVKITDIKDRKISLSMKAVEGKDNPEPVKVDIPKEYSTTQEATTNLSDLLKDLKIK